MKIEKAIEIINRKTSIPEQGESFDDIVEAFDMAAEALKRQIPKKMEAREFFRKTNEICKDNDCHVCPICEHCSDGIFIGADDAEGLVAIVEGYQNGR